MLKKIRVVEKTFAGRSEEGFCLKRYQKGRGREHYPLSQEAIIIRTGVEPRRARPEQGQTP